VIYFVVSLCLCPFILGCELDLSVCEVFGTILL
jgi:hypothetical protein